MCLTGRDRVKHIPDGYAAGVSRDKVAPGCTFFAPDEPCLPEVSHDFFKKGNGNAVRTGDVGDRHPLSGVSRQFAHEEERKILIFSEPHVTDTK
jgi:hypothetical protein